MNLPTKLTLLRILLTFVIMGLLFVPGWAARAAALVVFLFASLTDWLDGFLARRWHQTSSLGALLDPIADKVLVLGMFLAFVQLRLIPAWMVLIIALREFLITGVRLVAASRHVILSAAPEGKHKIASQLVTIFTILTWLLAQELAGRLTVLRGLTVVLQRVTVASLWVTIVFTVASGTSFFWRHQAILKGAVSR